MRSYVGIDGGGTGTRALCVDPAGRVLGYAEGGSANRNDHARAEVRENLRKVILAACAGEVGGLEGVFLGMGGVSTDADRQDVASVVKEIPEIGPRVRVGVENDTVVGLTGGLSGRPGIVLIGGTGAACLGRDARGRTYLCGGWGDMADDLGSAVWIGLRAIQSAVQSEDGRIGPTLLREAVFEHLGLLEPRALLDRLHNQGFARADMGKIAPLVVEASLKGDAVAEGILRDAARELSRLVATTAANLFGGTPSEMILVGGLALSGPPFQPMLIQQIQADTPSIRVVDPEMTPVQGAALEALRAAGHPWNAEVLANLQAGQA